MKLTFGPISGYVARGHEIEESCVSDPGHSYGDILRGNLRRLLESGFENDIEYDIKQEVRRFDVGAKM